MAGAVWVGFTDDVEELVVLDSEELVLLLSFDELVVVEGF